MQTVTNSIEGATGTNVAIGTLHLDLSVAHETTRPVYACPMSDGTLLLGGQKAALAGAPQRVGAGTRRHREDREAAHQKTMERR